VGSSHVAAITAFIHLSTDIDMIVAVPTEDSSAAVNLILNIFILILYLADFYNKVSFCCCVFLSCC